MTVTDFTLMAVLVIVITFGLIRASGVNSHLSDYYARLQEKQP